MFQWTKLTTLFQSHGAWIAWDTPVSKSAKIMSKGVEHAQQSIAFSFFFPAHGTCRKTNLTTYCFLIDNSILPTIFRHTPPFTSLLRAKDFLDDFHLIISKTDRVFRVGRFEVSALWLMVAASESNKRKTLTSVHSGLPFEFSFFFVRKHPGVN